MTDGNEALVRVGIESVALDRRTSLSPPPFTLNRDREGYKRLVLRPLPLDFAEASFFFFSLLSFHVFPSSSVVLLLFYISFPQPPPTSLLSWTDK